VCCVVVCRGAALVDMGDWKGFVSEHGIRDRT